MNTLHIVNVESVFFTCGNLTERAINRVREQTLLEEKQNLTSGCFYVNYLSLILRNLSFIELLVLTIKYEVFSCAIISDKGKLLWGISKFVQLLPGLILSPWVYSISSLGFTVILVAYSFIIPDAQAKTGLLDLSSYDSRYLRLSRSNLHT